MDVDLEQRRVSRMAAIERRLDRLEETMNHMVACVAEVDTALRGPKDLRTMTEKMTGVAAPLPVTDAPAGQVYVAQQMTLQEKYTGTKPPT